MDPRREFRRQVDANIGVYVQVMMMLMRLESDDVCVCMYVCLYVCLLCDAVKCVESMSQLIKSAKVCSV